jgi:hypothetical protein
MQQQYAGKGRRWLWPMLAVMLAVVAFTPDPASAWYEEYEIYDDGGPGTEFLRCRAQSWADLNTCLVRASTESDKRDCNWAFELDNIGCDIELVGNIVGGLIKAIFK